MAISADLRLTGIIVYSKRTLLSFRDFLISVFLRSLVSGV